MPADSPRHGALLQRNLRHTLPTAVGGHGVYLVDSDGKQYLDGSGGAVVSCLGHQHPEVLDAINRQLHTLAFAHTAFFTNDAAEQLAALLARKAPGPLNHTALVSGGSEAVEAAVKMARQYFVERGETGRTKFIARRRSYHGATLAALSIGRHSERRRDYLPMLLPGEAVSPCYPWRHLQDGESEAQYSKRLAQELEHKINEAGPGSVAAFLAETISGASLGAVPPSAAYFKEVRAVCDRYGVLLILDEVMCGVGRSGRYFAFEHEQITPDLVCLAKGLGGGYAPIGAVIATDEIFETMRQGSGVLRHGHTYMGHPLAAAAALAVQGIIERDQLTARVRRRGQALKEQLTAAFTEHPHVGDVRGRGLFIGIEFVRDRASKEPFPAAARVAEAVKARAMEHGLLCYPGAGCVDGKRGDHILIAPPFILSEDEAGQLTERTVAAVNQALAGPDA